MKYSFEIFILGGLQVPMQCARQKNGRSERASTPRERGNGNEEARKMAEEEAMVHGARFHRARFPLDAEDVSELWRRWRRRWQLLACRSSINISPFASSEQSGSLLILTKSSKYQQQRALQEVRNKTPFLVSVGFGILSLFFLFVFSEISLEDEHMFMANQLGFSLVEEEEGGPVAVMAHDLCCLFAILLSFCCSLLLLSLLRTGKFVGACQLSSTCAQ